MSSFVHLHVKSCQSLLDGAATATQYVQRAKALEMGAIAITDTANLCAAVELQMAAHKHFMRPIFGCELWVCDTSLDASLEEETSSRVTLLAETYAGYQSLCRLITLAMSQVRVHPRVHLEQLQRHTDGIVLLTGHLHGVLDAHQDLVHQRMERLLSFLSTEQLFVELVDHGIERQAQLVSDGRALAADHGLSAVATNAVTMLEQSDIGLHNAMRAAFYADKVDQLGERAMPSDQAWLKDEQSMRDLLGEQAVDNAADLAERLRVELPTGTFHMPRSSPPDSCINDTQRWTWLSEWFPPPDDFGPPPKMPPEDLQGRPLIEHYLVWYAHRGLDLRLQVAVELGHDLHEPAYRERIDTEIALIADMGFVAYMLIVAEFINWAKDRDIPVGPGRGSVAGCLVAWAMRITEVDSIAFSLFFERFLNPARKSMPDVDIDFARAGRERVIAHVRDRYGAESTGQIITYGTYKDKSAIKDAARVLRVRFDEANQWTSWIEEHGSLSAALQTDRVRAQYQGDPVFRRACHLANRLTGLVRQWGVHAAGVVITPGPLTDYAPVHLLDGKAVLGVDMNGCDTLGLIKFDFLGLKTLDIIEEALDSVQRLTGQRPDLDRVPLHDTAVYEMLSEGDGLGLFQVESHGLRDLLRRLKPSHIEELIAAVALYRPGPLGSGMTDDFVERKHGRSAPEPPHALLKDTLKETYGVIVYQEQVMRAAQEMAGYSLADADLLRRAMGKKKPKEMAMHRVKFIEGASEKGVSEEEAESVFEMINYFSGYGFNKSHSTAYGLITYRTAYLKAHHRAALMAAAMSWEAADRDRLLAYTTDLRTKHIEVLPPDINRSTAHFRVEDDSSVRFGLAAVQGVAAKAVSAILSERKRALFGDLEEFLQRIDRSAVNKTVIEHLAGAGAFDGIGVDREIAHAAGGFKRKSVDPGQQALFAPAQLAVPTVSTDDAWTWSQRLEHEQKALGLWLSGHPLDRFGPLPARLRTHTVQTLVLAKKRQPVALVVVTGSIHRLTTRQGKPMTYLTVSDETGEAEVVCFPEVTSRQANLIEPGRPLLVRGALDRSGEQGKLIVDELDDLDDLRERAATSCLIELSEPDTERLDELLDILRRHEGNRPVRIVLSLASPRCRVTLRAADELAVCTSPALFVDLERFTRRPDAAFTT